jgi:hypothetical protein
MKLKDYLKELEELVQEHPDYANLEVVSDAEGNSFEKVTYTGTAGHFEVDRPDGARGDFIDEDNFEEDHHIINSVCIN